MCGGKPLFGKGECGFVECQESGFSLDKKLGKLHETFKMPPTKMISESVLCGEQLTVRGGDLDLVLGRRDGWGASRLDAHVLAHRTNVSLNRIGAWCVSGHVRIRIPFSWARLSNPLVIDMAPLFDDALLYSSKRDLIEFVVGGISPSYLYSIMASSRNVESLALLASGVHVLLLASIPDAEEDQQFAVAVLSMGLIMGMVHFYRDLLLMLKNQPQEKLKQ